VRKLLGPKGGWGPGVFVCQTTVCAACPIPHVLPRGINGGTWPALNAVLRLPFRHGGPDRLGHAGLIFWPRCWPRSSAPDFTFPFNCGNYLRVGTWLLGWRRLWKANPTAIVDSFCRANGRIGWHNFPCDVYLCWRADWASLAVLGARCFLPYFGGKGFFAGHRFFGLIFLTI